MGKYEDKLEEAEYFLGQMDEHRKDKKVFSFYLSAFLAASRSVVVYAHDEINPKNPKEKKASPSTGSQRSPNKVWYDEYIASNDLMRCFRDKRNFDIHDEPFRPATAIDISALVISICAAPSMSVNMKNDKGEWYEVAKGKANSQADNKNTSTSAKICKSKNDIRYFLSDYPHKDVINLSGEYVNQIKQFLVEGRSLGHIPTD